ncbi:MAG: methylated-DNA--[protein]-cysteine S-methyltransferase [Nitrospirales bacterium]
MAKPPVPKQASEDSWISYWISPSPVGRLLLVGSPDGLQALQFQDGAHPLDIQPTWTKSCEPFRPVLDQLQEYFDGSRTRFQIALNLQGTPFQCQVWKALQSIPYGRTVSYGKIAHQIGSPKASRAVGAANGQNPVSIIVPCHRVIGANGKLVGYGGGLSIKTALLELEQHQTRKNLL